uniref:Uncharacterized protein n=1 Tax=Sus scrofa TaxID=9823 RepID=A0A4X1SIB1_PIG
METRSFPSAPEKYLVRSPKDVLRSENIRRQIIVWELRKYNLCKKKMWGGPLEGG